MINNRYITHGAGRWGPTAAESTMPASFSTNAARTKNVQICFETKIIVQKQLYFPSMDVQNYIASLSDCGFLNHSNLRGALESVEGNLV